MAAKACAAGLASAFAVATMGVEHAYADGTFNFAPFSTTSSSSSPAATPPAAAPPKAPPPEAEQPQKPRNDYPRTTSAGFDPEALERGVKALREISSSGQAKKVSPVLFFI